VGALGEPVPFEVYGARVYLHGAKADLAVANCWSPAASRTSRRPDVRRIFAYRRERLSELFG
jgi:hypothetical protein